MGKTKIEWTEFDSGWIAGMIDGEGWLSLIKEKRLHFTAKCTYKPTLGVSNKNIGIINKAKQLLGSQTNHWVNGNGVYMVAISSNLLRIILPQLKLIGKRKQQILLLEALDILSNHKGRGNCRTEKEIAQLENIYQQMHQLNANSGGKPIAKQD